MKLRTMLLLSIFITSIGVVLVGIGGWVLLRRDNQKLHITDKVGELSRSNKDLQRRINYLVELTGESTERLYIVEAVSKIIKDHDPSFDYEASLFVGEEIYDNWKKYNIMPSLQLSIIRSESSFIVNAVGAVGEQGLFQILPTTGAMIFSAINLGEYSDIKLKDPRINTKIAGYYLYHLKHMFWNYSKDENIYHYVLAAYNRGPRYVYEAINNNVSPETEYSKKIIDYSLKISKDYNIM